jgi:hypothetical protein
MHTIFRSLAALSALLTVAASPAGWTRTLTVGGPAGNGTYSTLQDAVDEAASEDNIVVLPGEYAGAVVENKHSLTIVGAGATLSSPPPDRFSELILSGVEDVRVEGFTFASYGEIYGGIHVFNGTRVVITNNEFRGPIAVDSHEGVTDCQFVHNRVVADDPELSGGFVWAFNLSPGSQGNLIAWNKIEARDVLLGAGVALWGLGPDDVGNRIEHNVFDLAPVQDAWAVGGILFGFGSGPLNVSYNDFTPMPGGTQSLGPIWLWDVNQDAVTSATSFEHNRGLSFFTWP